MTEDTYRDKLNSLQVEIEELRAKLKESQEGDTISRKAAIDAIPKTDGSMFENCRYCDMLSREQVVDILNSLPSAQPGIVRCKDCKYHDMNECKHSFALVVAKDNDFCSYAERRTNEVD